LRRLAPFLSAALLACPAGAVDYAYTTIIDNAGPYTEFGLRSARALNNGGEVAFFATQTTVGSGDIYKGSGHGTGVTQISTDSSHYVDAQYTGGINDGGSVVFGGGPAFSSNLYSGSGGDLTTVLFQGGVEPNPYWVLRGSATINDADAVAFRGGRKNPAGHPPGTTIDGYYIVSGGVTTMVEAGAVYSSLADDAPDFNDAGQAAFVATAVADGTQHVLRYDGPGITTVAVDFQGETQLSLNSFGDVAFVDATSVKLYRDGATTTIADTTDGFSALLRSGEGDVFVNDHGRVAFWGDVSTYQGNPVSWEGVYTGDDVVKNRVLVRGDSVLGHTLSAVELAGYNNAGQLLMNVTAQSPDPWRALIVATPVFSPDFDEDGDVDGADLLVWQRGGSLNPNGPSDLAGWKSSFGAATAATAAVPEPEAFVAAVAWLCAATTRRRRRD
jgi:hypothetical protein